MPKTAVKIGPSDHGRPMSLEDFEPAEGQEGYLYELARGVVTVSEVPSYLHLAQVQAIQRQIYSYDAAHAGVIHTIATGSECKIVVPSLETERHPDLAVYLSPPPAGEDVWSRWVPAIVVEVVSPGSEQRDYTEKREEYFAFGIAEYWIVDAVRRQLTVLRRSRKKWIESTVGSDGRYRTRLLPGFELVCGSVFQVAQG